MKSVKAHLVIPSSPTKGMADLGLLSEDIPATVKVAQFQTLLEAELARGRLSASGISASLSDAHTASMGLHLGQLCGGVKVHVRVDDEERAREILFTPVAMLEDEAEEDTDDAPAQTESIGRGRDMDAGAPAASSPATLDDSEELAQRALVTAGLGLCFLFPLTLYSSLCLLRLARRPGRSPRAERRARWALAINALAGAASAWFWTSGGSLSS